MKKCVAVAVVLLAFSATTWGFEISMGAGSMWLTTQHSALSGQSLLWPQQSAWPSQNPCGGCGSLSGLAGSWLSDCDCCGGCGCNNPCGGCGCGNPCGWGCGNPCGGCGCGCNNPCGGCGCGNPCGWGCGSPCGGSCGCGCDCGNDQMHPLDMLMMLWSF
jgi:hypothetical protein